MRIIRPAADRRKSRYISRLIFSDADRVGLGLAPAYNYYAGKRGKKRGNSIIRIGED